MDIAKLISADPRTASPARYTRVLRALNSADPLDKGVLQAWVNKYHKQSSDVVQQRIRDELVKSHMLSAKDSGLVKTEQQVDLIKKGLLQVAPHTSKAKGKYRSLDLAKTDSQRVKLDPEREFGTGDSSDQSVISEIDSGSYVVYRGASRAGAGSPNIVIILAKVNSDSKNEKTGPMAQMFIMTEEYEPHTAQAGGKDTSCCLSCLRRPEYALARKYSYKAKRAKLTKRSRKALDKKYEEEKLAPCYVRVDQSVLTTYRTNIHKKVDLAGAVRALKASGRPLRIGAYGDPGAVPEEAGQEIFSALIKASGGRWTGYTHAWRDPDLDYLKRFLMASVDNLKEAKEAWDMGWRTFRAMSRKRGDEKQKNEVFCPATKIDRTLHDLDERRKAAGERTLSQLRRSKDETDKARAKTLEESATKNITPIQCFSCYRAGMNGAGGGRYCDGYTGQDGQKLRPSIVLYEH